MLSPRLFCTLALIGLLLTTRSNGQGTPGIKEGDTLVYVETINSSSALRNAGDTTVLSLFKEEISLQTELIGSAASSEKVLHWQARRSGGTGVQIAGGAHIPRLSGKSPVIRTGKEYPWEAFTTDEQGNPLDSVAGRYFGAMRTELWGGGVNLAPSLWLLPDTLYHLIPGASYTVQGIDTIAMQKPGVQKDSGGVSALPLIRSYRLWFSDAHRFDSAGGTYLRLAWRVEDFRERMEVRNMRLRMVNEGLRFPQQQYETRGSSSGIALYDLRTRLLVTLEGRGSHSATVRKTVVYDNPSEGKGNRTGVPATPHEFSIDFILTCRRVQGGSQ